MAHLQFAHIEYSINTKSLDIFNIGCGNGSTNPKETACKGCCNPEIRDWNLKGYDMDYVLEKVKSLNGTFDKMIDKILLVGGSPVDAYFRYKDEMTDFLNKVQSDAASEYGIQLPNKSDSTFEAFRDFYSK